MIMRSIKKHLKRGMTMREDEMEVVDMYRDLVKKQLDEITDLNRLIYLRRYIMCIEKAEE